MAAVQQVTTQKLKDLGACPEQIELFRRTFGESADVTEANIVRAELEGLNVDWLGKRLVATETWREYEAATTESWKAHERENRSSVDVYKRECTAALLVACRGLIKAGSI